MSDYQAPAFITALTDAQLVETVRVHTEQIGRVREYMGQEFSIDDVASFDDERYWAEEELEHRLAVARFTAPVALTHSPFAGLVLA